MSTHSNGPSRILASSTEHLKQLALRIGIGLRRPKHLEFVVAVGDQVDECLEIRRQVFVEELGRSALSGAPAHGDADALDAASLHLACVDTRTGRTVGTIRITSADAIEDAALQQEYALERFDLPTRSHVHVVGHLSVLKSHRRGMVAPLLAMKSYEAGLDRLGTWVSVANCEPGLLSYYRRMGYRPLGRVHPSRYGGYRLSLYLVMHDYGHLLRAGSPFYALARARGFPDEKGGVAWWARDAADHGIVDFGFDMVEPSAGSVAAPLLEGLSAAGRAKILSRAVRIRGKVGDRIIKKGDRRRGVGIVVRGALEVRDGKRLLRVLGEGELFGEIAYVLGSPRTADIVAVTPDVEIVLLRLSALESATRSADQVRLWKNIARVLAGRLASGPG